MGKTNSTSVSAPTKFTQEIKDKWLTALKSGEYKQGIGQLEYELDGVTLHCCIGVLGCITEGLDNSKDYPFDSNNPWTFLDNTIGEATTNIIWKTNDGNREPEKKNLGNFLNVIPLIEQLPTQD